jgi:hypothetical protein
MSDDIRQPAAVLTKTPAHLIGSVDACSPGSPLVNNSGVTSKATLGATRAMRNPFG